MQEFLIGVYLLSVIFCGIAAGALLQCVEDDSFDAHAADGAALFGALIALCLIPLANVAIGAIFLGSVFEDRRLRDER